MEKLRNRFTSFLGMEKNLLLLFSTGVIAIIGLQLVQPLFPVYLQSLNASEIEISLVLSISSLAGTLLTIPAGYLIDKIGERKLLKVGISIWACSTFLIAFARDWKIVAFFYAFHGVADALVGPARMTLISTTSAQVNEATVFGIMSLDWLIGGTVSPPLSGFLVERSGWQLPLLGASAVFFLSMTPLLKLDIKRKNHEIKTGSSEGKEPIPLIPALKYFMFGASTNIAQSMIAAMLPIFLSNQLGLSTTIIGLFFTASTLASVLTQVPGGVIADKLGKKKLITLLLLPVPIIFGLWGTAKDWYVYLFLYVLSKGLMSMTSPATLAIVSEIFPKERKGSIYSLWMAGIRLGSAVGPLLGGYLYNRMGYISPFIGSGIIVAMSIPFIYFLRPEN